MPDLKEMMLAHINSIASRSKEEIYRVSPEYWDLTSSTFIENWPEAVQNLSIKSWGTPLSLQTAKVLGSYMGELGGGFDVQDIEEQKRKEKMNFLVHRLDILIADCGGRAFVRLGSRSPKDCWIPSREGDISRGLVRSGQEALRRLTADSERVYEDLQTALAMGYKPWIWIRQWVDIEPWSEFRCFVRDRKLIGISQYDYHLGRCQEIIDNQERIEGAIRSFFEAEFEPILHLDSVVFDVIIQRSDEGFRAKLLELNPYFGGTDPCTFKNLTEVEEVGGFRFCTEAEAKPKAVHPDPDELIAELEGEPIASEDSTGVQ